MQTLKQWIKSFEQVVENMEARDHTGKLLQPEQAFSVLFRKALDARQRNSTIFLIGNGASSSMAGHVAADLAKNGNLRTWAFNDPSLLTAVGNDNGYENIFSLPLRRLGDSGDMLIAISSSGNSPNIIKAAQDATELGIDVITFSAMQAENQLRKMGSLNFYVPATTYGHAESAHAALLHYWIDLHVDEQKKIEQQS